MRLPELAKFFTLPDLHKALPEWVRQLQAADRQNLKRGLDIEMAGGRLILTGDDGVRYAVSVASGILTLTAL
jgi:hypothetical protein